MSKVAQVLAACARWPVAGLRIGTTAGKRLALIIAGAGVTSTLAFSVVDRPAFLQTPWIVALLGAVVGFSLPRGLRGVAARPPAMGNEDPSPEREELSRLIVAAVEQSPVSVVITDRDGAILYVNPKFTEVSGYRLDEALGQTPRVLKSGEQDPQVYRELWQTILDGREWRGDFLNRRKDGTLFWEVAAIAPIRGDDGAIRHFVAVKEDISARKVIEEERRRFEEELARVDRLNLLGELAAALAHEVRQPLATIVNYAAGCLRRVENGADAQTLVFALDRIVEQGKLAGAIVSHIRSLVAGTVPSPGRVDVNQLVRHACDLLRVNAERHGVIVTLDLSPATPRVMADAIHVQQVLLNLMLNAVQAMDAIPRDRRQLCVRTAPEAKGGLMVTVEDGGPGASEADLRKFFKPFHTTKPNGMGMGLAISRRIVEAHGGHIRVTRNERGGLSFQFSLPGMDHGHTTH